MNLFLKTGISTVVVSVLLSSTGLSQDRRPQSELYTWKNVQMVGGGHHPGLVRDGSGGVLLWQRGSDFDL